MIKVVVCHKFITCSFAVSNIKLGGFLLPIWTGSFSLTFLDEMMWIIRIFFESNLSEILWTSG